MATMTEHFSSSAIVLGSTPTTRLGQIRGRDRRALSSPHRARRRAHTLRPQRVVLARRRLAAGRYDSDELLDAVLDMVIEDLTS